MLIVYVVDLIMVLKVVMDYVKSNDKFVIFGGFMGLIVFNVDGVKLFVIFLFFDELCVKFLGMI